MARHNVIYVQACCARDNPLGKLYKARQRANGIWEGGVAS